MPELKPCPFCGSEAMTSWNDKFGWQAFCGNDSCFMSQIIATTFETEEQAIQSWNNRTRYDKQEPECMLRGSHDGCNRNCADCKLAQDDYELHEMYTNVIALLKEQHEIIRCKDCKHYDPDIQLCHNGLDGIFLPDWFCADGERR